jgi:hypothetical protein
LLNICLYGYLNCRQSSRRLVSSIIEIINGTTTTPFSRSQRFDNGVANGRRRPQMRRLLEQIIGRMSLEPFVAAASWQEEQAAVET